MRVDPFHLVSTPIPVLPNLGLRSEVGLSSEDPSGHRHKGIAFNVWLTVYSPEGARVRRTQIGALEAGERKFFDLSGLTADLSYAKPYLCVVHRIPSDLEAAEGGVELAEGRDLDFDMFRSVCQLVHPSGARGSVIYETPPFFNANTKRPGSFLSFSNQIFVGGPATTHLALVHYSVNAKYETRARRRVLAYDGEGKLVGSSVATAAPFTVDVIDCAALVGKREKPAQFSFVACSDQASMIPLIVNTSEKPAGVSVEHTHPPISYLNMPMELAMKVRAQAVEHYMALPEAVAA